MSRFTMAHAVALVGTTAVLAVGTVHLASAEDDAPAPQASSPASSPADKPDTPADKPSKPAGGSLGLLGGSLDADKLSDQIGKLPQNLREDLADALVASDADRAKLIEDIVAGAKSGEYGDEIKGHLDRAEKFRENFGKKAKERWDAMPQALKDDLEALKGLDRDARKNAWAKIRENAAAGQYGDDYKDLADRFPLRHKNQDL